MITVVASVYNNGQYLPKFMDSILGQTYRDFELILVDDGSADGSAETCDQQAARDERVRLFHKPNGGLSSARNLGIEQARGEYIIFPDPDDWVELDYLEKLLSIRERNGADLSICGHFDHIDGKIRVWNAGAKERVLNTEEAMNMLMRPNAYCGYAWNKLYRMDVIREHDLRFDTELGMMQDLHFAVRYFQYCKTVAYDPVPLYHYNHDSGGVTAIYSPLTKRKLSCFLTYRKIADLTKQDHPAIAILAYSSMCHMSLQYIFIYYRSRMKDKDTLKSLKNNYQQYKGYYLSSDAYTSYDKRFSWCVPISTRLYYFFTFWKKVILYLLSKRRR